MLQLYVVVRQDTIGASVGNLAQAIYRGGMVGDIQGFGQMGLLAVVVYIRVYRLGAQP